MSITFSVDEIFEMAEQIERNGAKFYRAAAAFENLSANRSLLLRLAEMEDDHEKTFSAMRAKLSDAEKRSYTADPDNEGALYLQALADGKVFEAEPAKELSGSESAEQILNIAIGLEKDSVVFYQSMKDVVPRASGKEWLDEIIKQEIGHIVDLGGQLANLGR